MSKDYQFEYLTVANARVHFRRTGAGRPVLFLHGISGAMTPLAFFDELAKERAVLILTIRVSASPLRQDGCLAWVMLLTSISISSSSSTCKIYTLSVTRSVAGSAAEIVIRNSSSIRSLTLLSPAGARVKGVMSGDFFLWSPEERAHNLFHDQSLASQALAATSEPSV